MRGGPSHRQRQRPRFCLPVGCMTVALGVCPLCSRLYGQPHLFLAVGPYNLFLLRVGRSVGEGQGPPFHHTTHRKTTTRLLRLRLLPTVPHDMNTLLKHQTVTLKSSGSRISCKEHRDYFRGIRHCIKYSICSRKGYYDHANRSAPVFVSGATAAGAGCTGIWPGGGMYIWLGGYGWPGCDCGGNAPSCW